MTAVRSFANSKPIVVLRSGTYDISSKAMLSHSALLAGEDMVYEAKASGVLLSSSDSRATLQDIYDPILHDSQNNAATFYNLLRQEMNIGDYARWVIRSAPLSSSSAISALSRA